MENNKPTVKSNKANADMLMNADYIAQLAQLMNDQDLHEIEMQKDDVALRLVRGAPMMQMPMQMQTGQTTPATQPMPSVAPAPSAENTYQDALKSPMVGTVFLSPQPGSPKFAEIGQTVKEGQTLLIIEAMKVMNQIQAPKSGTLRHVMVEDGEPVEYAQALLVIA